MVHTRDTNSRSKRNPSRSRPKSRHLRRNKFTQTSRMDDSKRRRQPPLGNLRIPRSPRYSKTTTSPLCSPNFHPRPHNLNIHHGNPSPPLPPNLVPIHPLPLLVRLQNRCPRRRNWPNPTHNPKLSHSSILPLVRPAPPHPRPRRNFHRS